MTDEEARRGLDDLHAVALTIYGEAAGEAIEGKVAVGSVIRTRLQMPRRFGSTYRAVCHGRAQFSCWWKFGGDVYHKVLAFSRALVDGREFPATEIELQTYAECLFVAEGIIGGQLRDRVKGATHYYNPKAMAPPGRVPDWAQDASGKERAPVAVVGAHRFFSGVA